MMVRTRSTLIAAVCLAAAMPTGVWADQAQCPSDITQATNAAATATIQAHAEQAKAALPQGPSTEDTSCVQLALNASINDFFEPPSLSQIYDTMRKQLCNLAQSKFNSMVQQAGSGVNSYLSQVKQLMPNGGVIPFYGPIGITAPQLSLTGGGTGTVTAPANLGGNTSLPSVPPIQVPTSSSLSGTGTSSTSSAPSGGTIPNLFK